MLLIAEHFQFKNSNIYNENWVQQTVDWRWKFAVYKYKFKHGYVTLIEIVKKSIPINYTNSTTVTPQFFR